MRTNQTYKIFLLSCALLLNDAVAQPTTIGNELLSTNSADPVSAKTAAATDATKDVKADASKTLINQAKDGLASILLGTKISSLMLDDQESGNLDRAIESFKNNQAYSPEDSEYGANSGLSAEERKKLAETEQLKKSEETKNRENEKSYIYLASIIYFSPKDWIVWINDKKITSKTNDSTKELYVESIKRDHVRIFWKLSLSKWKVISGLTEDRAPETNRENQVEIHFELKPNQTFMLSTSNVVEGQALTALLKKKEEDKKTDAGAAVIPVANP